MRLKPILAKLANITKKGVTKLYKSVKAKFLKLPVPGRVATTIAVAIIVLAIIC